MRNDSTALVSVIVPICNAEEFLAQALKSIQNQSYENLEIICLNDGSKDSSLEIVKRFAADDDRFIVVDKQNEGYGATCNLGIDMARGKWISILEPDDWVDTNMYQDMLEFAARFDEEIDIIKTPWEYVHYWNDPSKMFYDKAEIYSRIPTSKKPFTLKDHPILIEGHPAIWSALYRRDFLNENDIRFIPYPGAGWADNPFLIETMVQAKTIVYLDKPYYYYRFDLPNSTLNHATEEAVARPFDRWMDMLDVFERLGIDDPDLLNSHYLRGFNYTSGAIYDDGWDHPVVRSKTHELFSRMDKARVLDNPKIRNSMKRFYLKEMGLQDKVSFSPARAKHVMKESGHLLKKKGPLGIFKRIARRFQVRPASKKTKRS